MQWSHPRGLGILFSVLASGRRFPMRTSLSVFAFVFISVAAVALLVPPPAAAQAAGQAWIPSKTADGQPDIQGLWNNVEAFFTPFERPSQLAGREDVSAEELQEVLEEVAMPPALDAHLQEAPAHSFRGGQWLDCNLNILEERQCHVQV